MKRYDETESELRCAHCVYPLLLRAIGGERVYRCANVYCPHHNRSVTLDQLTLTLKYVEPAASNLFTRPK